MAAAAGHKERRDDDFSSASPWLWTPLANRNSRTPVKLPRGAAQLNAAGLAGRMVTIEVTPICRRVGAGNCAFKFVPGTATTKTA